MKLRAYFNQRSDYPLIWSVDAGDTSSEVICKGINVLIPMHTEFNAAFNPCAWLAGNGVAMLRDGVIWLVTEDVADALKAAERCEFTRLFQASGD